MHPQNRLYGTSYGSAHEISNLRTFVCKRGAQSSGSRATPKTPLFCADPRYFWRVLITLHLLAHAYLAAVRSMTEEEEDAAKKGITPQVSIPS